MLPEQPMFNRCLRPRSHSGPYRTNYYITLNGQVSIGLEWVGSVTGVGLYISWHATWVGNVQVLGITCSLLSSILFGCVRVNFYRQLTVTDFVYLKPENYDIFHFEFQIFDHFIKKIICRDYTSEECNIVVEACIFCRLWAAGRGIANRFTITCSINLQDRRTVPSSDKPICK